MDYGSFMGSSTKDSLNDYNFIDTSLSFEKIVKIIGIFSLQLLILSMQILINVNGGNEAIITAENVSHFYFQFLQNILINYGLTLIILIYFFNNFANTKFNLSKTAKRSLLKFYILVYGLIFIFIDGLFLYNFYYVFLTQWSNATFKWATIHGFFVNIILIQLVILWLLLGIFFCIYKTVAFLFSLLFPNGNTNDNKKIYYENKFYINTRNNLAQNVPVIQDNFNTADYEHDTSNSFNYNRLYHKFNKTNPVAIHSYKSTIEKLRTNDQSYIIVKKFLQSHKEDFKEILILSTPLNFKEDSKELIIQDYNRLEILLAFNNLPTKNKNAIIDFSMEIFSEFLTKFGQELQKVYTEHLLESKNEFLHSPKIKEEIKTKFTKIFNQWESLD